MPSYQQSQGQESCRSYFDFVRGQQTPSPPPHKRLSQTTKLTRPFSKTADFDIDGGHVSLQAVHVVETAKRYAAAYGDTDDVLMREAAQKYRSTEHRGREFGFYGAIINQLKYPLSEEIIKHMERKEKRRHRR